MAVVAPFFAFGVPAAAQQVLRPFDRPDPAGIALPDLTASPGPRDSRGYDTYFYFRKPGVGYETAFADIDQCRIYSLSRGLVAPPPKFVPLGTDAVRHDVVPTESFVMQYGLVGLTVAAIAIAGEQEDARIATLRRCMSYKGYRRYGTSRANAEQIGRGEDAQSVARMALVAAAPASQAEALDP